MLEDKIQNIINKHQELADQYHEMAVAFREHGLKDKSWEVDKLAHPHEGIAMELRLALK